MENKTNTQTASNKQATTANGPTANLNSNTFTLSKGALWAVEHNGKELIEILNRFSAADYMAQLQTMDFEYKNLLHAIDAGGGLERDPDENPAEVLADLRKYYTPTPRQLADRANLLCCMFDLLRTADELVNGIKRDFGPQ